MSKIGEDFAKATREAGWALEVFSGLVAFYLRMPRPGQWCRLYPEPHPSHGNCPGIKEAV